MGSGIEGSLLFSDSDLSTCHVQSSRKGRWWGEGQPGTQDTWLHHDTCRERGQAGLWGLKGKAPRWHCAPVLINLTTLKTGI